MSARIGSFEKDGKSYPTLEFYGTSKDGKEYRLLTFGVGKAKVILNHVEDIKNFVAEYGTKKEG